jgi:spore coat polysaccharide biosynthesis protein SpsF
MQKSLLKNSILIAPNYLEIPKPNKVSSLLLSSKFPNNHFVSHILPYIASTKERKSPVLTPQENFWINKIAEGYAQDNSTFNEKLGLLAWERMLKKIDKSEISTYLDCGSNIGRNIGFLKHILPMAAANIVELAPGPYEKCINQFEIQNSFLGPIKEAKFDKNFDLVFSSGVLIHVNPNDLLESMSRMYQLSSKYILISEYFNRTPVMISYRGEDDRLFKCDFGKLFVENFDCRLLDYGFLWGHEFDSAGFDDITYWLFEKN